MEMVGIYKTVDHEICSERGPNTDEDAYANEDRRPRQTEIRAQIHGRRCVVLSTACFCLMCLLLVASIIALHIKLTAERETHTTQMLQSTVNDQTRVKDLAAEKNQLQSNFNSLSQKKQELETSVHDLTVEKKKLETRINDLSVEKEDLQSNVSSVGQKKLELETRVNDLTAEKGKLQRGFDTSSQKNIELETTIKDLTAERNQLQSNFNSLSQKKQELETSVHDLTVEKSQLETRINDLTAEKNQSEARIIELTAEKSQLQRSFDSSSKKINEMETRVNNLTVEKRQLQRDFDSLSQIKLEMETELQKLSQQGFFFISNGEKSWSESRQFCRDHGGDLVIIKTEEKQRFLSSFVKEFVWIGLSDTQREGTMTWVDNSPLIQGFWEQNEPNDAGGNEDCIELNPGKSVLSNWNDIPCSAKRQSVCERKINY